MGALWDANRELTAQEIADAAAEKGDAYRVASIHQVLPRLLEKEMIKITAFKVAKTKYVRAFMPLITRDEYAAFELQHLWGDASARKFSGLKGVIHAFLDNDPNEGNALIEDISDYIKNKCSEPER